MDEWITAKEAAARWGVGERVAQAYCKNGRIPGARKLGASWMLPVDAQKPTDPRGAKQAALPPLYDGLFLLESIRFDGRSIDEIDATLGSEDERRQFRAELAYFQGDTPRMLSLIDNVSEDSPFALGALHGHNIACIQSGDYEGFMACVDKLNRMRERYRGHTRALWCISLAEATAAASVYAAKRCPEWLKRGELGELPASARPYAMYVYARYLHGQGERAHMLGVTEAALALSDGRGFTIAELYLRIMRAVAFIELNEPEKARPVLAEAYALARPYRLFSPFSENVSILRGELDALLKAQYPDDYKPVLAGWKRAFEGFMEIHNRIQDDKVSKLLTLKEHQLGLYLSQGLSYKEIAARMGLSVSTVNNYMQTIRDKLGVRTSAEIVDYILWT